MLALAEITPWHWAGFILAVLFLLGMDLGFFHRRAHVVKFKEAIAWTSFWCLLSLAFAFYLWKTSGRDKAELFLTGYLVELSLSMDNVFVIALIFGYFRVEPAYQHRVLFWGILGALIMRGAMIWLGTELIQRFHWTLYVFGAFLIFTGIKMLFADSEGVHPEKNPLIRLAQKFFPVTTVFEEQKFLTRNSPSGRLALTPLALVLIMVETTDLVFALDSIPAIFGVTTDPFIVFTSNVFAILGLRSLYFVLAGAIRYFQYLKYGLSMVLVFIGVKMTLPLLGIEELEISTRMALLVVAGIIILSILVSVLAARKRPPES